jgi:AraC-like DNA-binding protein
MMAMTIARWQPPYSESALNPFTPLESAGAGCGDVLLLRVSECDDAARAAADTGSLGGVVSTLRRRFPGAPVALWIPEGAPEHVIDLARAATGSHVRAILGGPAPDPERLRFELTHPLGLGGFVLRWASDAGYLPPDTVETEVCALLDAAPNVRTLQRLARDRHEATRTWRSRLRQLGLPSPRAWLGLAHTLHLAFYLQRNREQPLQRIADALGFTDATLMSHRLKHAFRISPGAVRALLGAEPLLHRWFYTAVRRLSR